MDELKMARPYALKCHGQQRYGEYPYSVHLDAVAAIVKDVVSTADSRYFDTAIAIAYLHDVVEDTDVSIEEITKEFGGVVAVCVAILTDELGSNRKQRKAKTYAKMAMVKGEQELALLVKAADRLANLRACMANDNQRLLTVYKDEHPVFKQAVYRNGLCDAIWHELDKIVALAHTAY